MTEVLDSQGNTIRVGMRTAENDGEVAEITDPDGDTDSYGLVVGIAPRVTVFYDDNTIDTYTTRWNATGPWDDHRDDYTCDDLTVAVNTIGLPPVPEWVGEPREFREPDGQRMTEGGRIVPTDQ